MDIIGYIASLDLAPSDWLYILASIPAVWFIVVYGGLTKWFLDPLGWVVLVYALSVAGLLTLIVYATFAGQRIDETVRFMLGAGLLVGLCGKVVFLHVERRNGRIEKRKIAALAAITGSHPTIEESKTMTDITPTPVVPEIWYKGKRVLRTLVQVGIPTFLTFALVLPQIIEALGLPADSELRLWLLAVAAGVTAVALAITRIMAIPAVNSFLTKIGLGSVPADALVATTILDEGRPVAVITSVTPDPKVTGAIGL